MYHKWQSSIAVVRWSHEPKVQGSNPCSAYFFILIYYREIYSHRLICSFLGSVKTEEMA